MLRLIMCFMFYCLTIVALSQKDTIQILKLISDAEALEQNQPKKALEIYVKTYNLSLKAKYKNGVYKSLFNSGFPYSNMGVYDSALIRFNKTIVFCEKNNMPIGIAKAQANIANMYQYKGDFNGAIKYYLLAIKSFETAKDSISTATSYKNLSSIYTQFQNEKLEFYYLKKAEQFNLKSDFYGLGLLYNDIALAYMRYDNFAKALIYLRKAEQMSKKAPNLDLQFYVIRNYGDYHRIKKEYSKAIPYYEKALKLADSAVDIVRKCDLIYITSELYLQNGDYPKAFQLATQSLELSRQIKAKDIEYKALKKLSLIYIKLNQPQKAYTFLENSNLIKDSIFSEKNAKELTLLQTQFETEKKDKSIADQNVKLKNQELNLIKNQKQKQSYFIAITLLVLFSFCLWYFFKQRQKLKNQEIESLKQNQEISNLEALIDGEERERKRIAQELHDGLNGDLSAIKYRLSTLEESGLNALDSKNLIKVIDMIDESCAQVRSISHNLMPASIMEYGLIESIREYCLKINSSDHFNIDFQSFGNKLTLSEKKETVIYRIVQELVVNILKHSKATEAMIQFNSKEDELFITVEDNGIGFETSKISKGIGLKNIKTRIDFLNTTWTFLAQQKERLIQYL